MESPTSRAENGEMIIKPYICSGYFSRTFEITDRTASMTTAG